jgi:hypothetical protein
MTHHPAPIVEGELAAALPYTAECLMAVRWREETSRVQSLALLDVVVGDGGPRVCESDDVEGVRASWR